MTLGFDSPSSTSSTTLFTSSEGLGNSTFDLSISTSALVAPSSLNTLDWKLSEPTFPTSSEVSEILLISNTDKGSTPSGTSFLPCLSNSSDLTNAPFMPTVKATSVIAPSIEFFNRPKSSLSSSSAARNSVTGLANSGYSLMILESLSSCALKEMKSETVPAIMSPLQFNCAFSPILAALVILANLPNLLNPLRPLPTVAALPNAPATGMKPVKNWVIPSAIEPVIVLLSPAHFLML